MIDVVQTRWERATRLRTHSHADARVVVLLRGTFEERYENSTRLCTTGTAIYRPPGERHSQVFTSERGSYVSAAIPERWFADVDCSDLLSNRGTAVRNHRVAHLGRMISVAAARTDRWSNASVAGLVLQVLAEIGRHRSIVSSSRQPWIDRVCEAIKRQPGASWPLAKVAALAGVHPSHLVREFRGHVGTTVGEFVRSERLEAARRLIERTPIPLAEVSIAAGFYDQGHLGRVFKGTYGLTPAEYRRAARREDTKALASS